MSLQLQTQLFVCIMLHLLLRIVFCCCDELANESNKENKTSKFSADIEEVPSALSMSNFTRCNVSLRGNGLKVLTANNFIPSQTPIIECRGKYMLGSGNHRYVFCSP